MVVARKSAVIPFVLGGVLGLAALVAWFFAIAFASSAPAACNSTYSVFAEVPQCRWPALFVALGWVVFIAAIASAWVGGVRIRRNRTHGAPGSRKGRGAPPHDAQPLV